MTKIGSDYYLLEGSYYIEETKAPAGYEAYTQRINFSIVTDTNVTSVSGTTAGVVTFTEATGTAVAGITLKDDPIEIKINKVDDSQPAVAIDTAVFNLYAGSSTAAMTFANGTAGYAPSTATGATADLTTTAGVITITTLPAGTYTLKETQAPSTYGKPGTSQQATFTVDNAGVITMAAGNGSDVSKTAADALTIKNSKNSLTINKTFSAASKDARTFALYQGTVKKYEATADNASNYKAVFTGIVDGTYTVKESIPESATDYGYLLPAADLFTVTVTDGEIALTGSATDVAFNTATGNKTEATVTNRQNSLVITKQYMYGSNKVNSTIEATFELKNNTTNAVVTGTNTYDTTNNVRIYTYTGIPAGTYTLTETATGSENYIKPTTTYQVTVDAEGKVSVDSAAASDQATLTINNYKKADFSFVKVDETGAGLGQASFQLKKLNVTLEEEPATATSATAGVVGTVSFNNVDQGVYELTETAAPNTYVKSSATAYVKVDAQGSVTYWKNEACTEALANLVQYFVNTKNSLTVTKTYSDNGTAKVSTVNAAFTLVNNADTLKNINLDTTDGITYTTAGIPDGTYSLTETTVPTGYDQPTAVTVVVDKGTVKVGDATTGVTAATATVTNVPTPVTISGTKTWNIVSATHATSITVNLYKKTIDDAEKELVISKEVTGDAAALSWSFSFDKDKNDHALPMYYKGQEIAYSVTETLNGYETTISDYNITNSENQLTITKTLRDQNAATPTTTAPVNDAVGFTLYNADGTTVAMGEQKVAAGNVIFQQLQNNTDTNAYYVLKETTTPDGYITSPNLYVKVTDGKIAVSEDTSFTSGVNRATQAVVNYKKGYFSFQKTIEGGYLNGANFVLKKTGTSIPKTSEGTENNADKGLVSFDNLDPGTYTLEETSAPSTYVKSDAVVTVNVAADGKVTYADAKGSAMTTAQVKTAFQNTQNSLVVNKKLFNTGKGSEITAWPTNLGTITFTLAQGETKLTANVDKDTNAATFTGLADGDYTLTETVTDGTFIRATKSVSVKVANGKISVANGTGAAAQSVDYNNYKRPDVSFTKQTTETGNAGLGGATFELKKYTAADESTVVSTNAEVPSSLAAGTLGTVTFTNLEQGIYGFTEKAAPDTYVKSDAERFLKVNEDGTYAFYETYANAAAGTSAITVSSVNEAFRNAPNSLTVKKTYATYGTTSAKESTAKAAFTLVHQPKSGETKKDDITLTPNTDGTSYTTSKIPDGTWKLHEVAPTGYDAAADVDVVVTNGKVSYAGADAVTNSAPATAIANAITTIEVSVTKAWDNQTDRGDSQVAAITSATMTLKVQNGTSTSAAVDATGTTVAAVTVSTTDGLSHTFENLPKYKDGVEIQYVVEETRVDGYVTTMTGTAADGFTYTNKENSLTINKSFFDNSDKVDLTGTAPTFVLTGTKTDGSAYTNTQAMRMADGKVIFDQIPDGTYTLKESATDEHYILSNKEYAVAVSAGAVTITGNDYAQTNATNPELTYSNYKKGHFQFQKTTKDGFLNGATFQLKQGDTMVQEKVSTGTESNVATGVVAFADILPGDYTLVETDTMPGYEIVSAAEYVKVHVTDMGVVSFKDAEDTDMTEDGLDAYFKNEETAITILKKDNAGKGVANATLKITATSAHGYLFKDSTKAEKVTSVTLAPTTVDADGNAVAIDVTGMLVAGVTYKLSETARVAGYLMLPAEVEFKLAKDGTMQVISGATKESEAGANKSVINLYSGNTITARDEVIKGSVELTKTVGSQVIMNGGVIEYEGITFELYRSDSQDGANAAKVTLGAPYGEGIQLTPMGKVTITNLPEGYYFFKEIATQDGLCLNSGKSTIGHIGVDEHEGPAVTVAMDNVNFETYVTLTKTDLGDDDSVIGETGDVIKDAEFTLYKVEGTKETQIGDAKPTDEEGKLTFTICSKGTYKVVETKAAKGYVLGATPYTATFTVDNTDAFQKQTLDLSKAATTETAEKYDLTVNGSFAGDGIANTRDRGKVTLLKTDSTDEASLNGVTFTLYKKDAENVFDKIFDFLTGKTYKEQTALVWTGENDEAGKLTIEDLPWGEYYIQESGQAPGYGLLDKKYEFTIDSTTGKEIELSVDLGTIENDRTVMSFTKRGFVYETCSDTTIEGAPDPATTKLLKGAEFTVFKDEACEEPAQMYTVSEGGDVIVSKAAIATSDDKGIVTYERIPVGTYYIKETKAPDGYVLGKTVYKATLEADGTFTGLMTLDDKEVQDNILYNDVPRTNIEFTKVSKDDSSKKLAGSTYGLYRKASAVETVDAATALKAPGTITAAANIANALLSKLDSGEILIATAVTDANGLLKFEGVLTGVEYTIKELIAPDGSQVSEKPMKITFKANADGSVVVDKIDDGSGTVYVDPVTGEIIWKEPQIKVGFSKVDEQGNLLAGAVLQVTDKDGKVIEKWTSAKEEHIIAGVLLAGETYTLTELSAPSGYDIAKAITFTVEAKEVGPTEDYVQQIKMVDKKTPTKTTTTTTTSKKPAKTSDESNAAMWMALMLFAAGGAVATTRRKKKIK